MCNSDNNNFNDSTNLETVENSKTSFKDSCKTIWEKMICNYTTQNKKIQVLIIYQSLAIS